MYDDVESKAHDLENAMPDFIQNFLRILAGGGDMVRLRDQLASIGTHVIETNKAQMDGMRDGTVKTCSPLDINAIRAAVNKFFDYERQCEIRDKTGIRSAEHDVVKQALRLAAGNGNSGQLWDSISNFNVTMKEVHPHRHAPAMVVPNKKNADPEHARWLDEILTLEDAASVRKVSIDTIRSEIQKGNLQAVRLSARRRGMTRREAMKSIRINPK